MCKVIGASEHLTTWKGEGHILLVQTFSHSFAMPCYTKTHFDNLPAQTLIDILKQYRYYSHFPASCGLKSFQRHVQTNRCYSEASQKPRC